jgi:putative transcriptional regulator
MAESAGVFEFQSNPRELAGSVLLAHPGLRDPNFRSTAVFLSMHGAAEGAFGMVLNRPTGKRLREFMPGKDLGLLAMAPVYWGGPVSGEQLLLSAFRWEEDLGVWNWRHDLTVESATEVLEEEGTVLRVFAGYSGWGKGQLEAELRSGTWVVQSPDSQILDPDGVGPEFWKLLICRQGPVYEFLTREPGSLGWS